MESKVLEQIIGDIKTFKEDHPQIIITNQIIKDIIQIYQDELVEEIREEI